MLGDALLYILQFLIAIIFYPFTLVNFDLSQFYVTFHFLSQFMSLAYHIMLLDLVFKVALSALIFEGGLFGIQVFLRSRGFLNGNIN